MSATVMFNMHILFKSKYGRRFREKSLAAKRAPGFLPAYVIVYIGNSFGIFSISEFTEIIITGPNKIPP